MAPFSQVLEPPRNPGRFTQATKVQQKNETLRTGVGALRTELIEKNRLLEKSAKIIERITADLQRLQDERAIMLTELAETSGKLQVTTQLVASLEARAIAAETCMADVAGRHGTAATGDDQPSSPPQP